MNKVYVVGAGPGDPKLLTVYAYELIKSADVVLHDNLVSDEIMSLISKDCTTIYVGRKYGEKSNQTERQNQINDYLRQYWMIGKRVVRLKSGDPYIYGRAAEEARFLIEHNIPFEVVPGISAAQCAANRFNLPITERSASNAMLICTAHTADYSTEQLKGIGELLKEGNSLALYMGLKSLDKLIPKLLEISDNPLIPVNAISNVSRSNEKMVSGTLQNIREYIEKEELPMPVVFVIGVRPIMKNVNVLNVEL